MNQFYLACFFLFCSFGLGAQQKDVIRQRIDWGAEQTFNIQNINPSTQRIQENLTDIIYKQIPFKRSKIQNVQLLVDHTEVLDSLQTSYPNITTSEFIVQADISEIRGQYLLNTIIQPFRLTKDNKVEKLVAYRLEVTSEADNNYKLRGPTSTLTSVLSSGDIYKISVDKGGLYKIDRAFLETKLRLDVSRINPKKIKIYGGRGGRLPELNSEPRIDDLNELSIFVSGEVDGKIDANDYILFYAEGPDVWTYDEKNNIYLFDKNIYDDKNYYFIKIDDQDGKRISKSIPVTDVPTLEIANYDMLQRVEDEKINLLGSFSGTEGTGKEWYGDIFSAALSERNYTSRFDFAGLVTTLPMEIQMGFAGRSNNNSSVNLSIGTKSISKNIQAVSVLNAEAQYARNAFISDSFLPDVNPQVKISYPTVANGTEGWLNYLQIVSSRELSFNASQISFRNRKTINQQVASFTVSNFTNQTVWDITDPFNPQEIALTGNKLIFRPQNQLREFVSHNLITGAYEPLAIGKIVNQNLHSMVDEDMIIVSHPLFANEAKKLGEHRKSHAGLKVVTVTTDQVYHEFSSGKTDPAAIRDMASLLLSRNPNFKYLLLFGDGSYDYKGLVKDIPAENFVPAYQTDESLDPIDGYPSDDFYGLLGANEGVDLKGGLDIYVGRLPAKTIEEAQILVNKIIHYETSPATLGDWRIRAGYVADDEDGNTHVRDMDEIAILDENRHKLIVQQKVYADAYRQISTPGESRYPDVNKTINDNIFKGQLSLTYLGHGGPLGWAQERILTVPEIQAWTNYDKMAIMVTSTCSFAAYDDPSVLSPAEYAILNSRGGAIALLSTTRAVYTNSNMLLTDGVHELLFKKNNGKSPTLGFVLAEGKNRFLGDFFRVNSRKFTLLGDPALQVALPKYNIVTSAINNKDAITVIDTLNALEKVTIDGYVSDESGNVVSAFNGTIFPTIFDKKNTLQTLSNDTGSPKLSFTSYSSIIFKGAATVKDGKWSVSFWVPKNINYTFGRGKITYYATDGKTDAAGEFTNVIIGGTNTTIVQDDRGPSIDMFLNDESFISGGITSANPILLLDLKDDFGINVTGNAIGQDITAVVDGNSQNIFILNDFYEAAKDDFSRGKVRFPLSQLEKGSHFIVAKAWDISGNSAEKRLDFVVAESEDNKLKHVYNYPNPFTTSTNFQFVHDLTNTEIDVIVNIYTITGKLVKSIVETKYNSGFRVNDISWNGKDDFESNLGRGIYLYKITVHSKELNLTRESFFEKLIKL